MATKHLAAGETLAARERPSRAKLLARAALGSGEDPLQLRDRVERPLCAYRPVEVERDRVRAARNRELVPRVAVPRLVEDLERDERVAPKRCDRRRQRATEAASVGREHGEREARTGRTREALDQRGSLPDLGTF